MLYIIQEAGLQTFDYASSLHFSIFTERDELRLLLIGYQRLVQILVNAGLNDNVLLLIGEDQNFGSILNEGDVVEYHLQRFGSVV